MTNGITNMAGSVPEWCAMAIELLGIAIITVIAIYALLHAGIRLVKGDPLSDIQQQVRQQLGRGILLGLEFLIAADIIHTVAVELTFENVGVLALVVLIRTFLSFTLELELTGKWPWQQAGSETKNGADN
ncbi:MAG: hypothetical protein CVV11_03055 [Gammaproteobacteria bacterium HGW-Gammaproteobacteria-15]|nr:MAG: hypothetical protein CVV11_03055 [Gammaproteobacteria bacterium HGW-Gammaproteobacteria-15]